MAAIQGQASDDGVTHTGRAGAKPIGSWIRFIQKMIVSGLSVAAIARVKA